MGPWRLPVDKARARAYLARRQRAHPEAFPGPGRSTNWRARSYSIDADLNQTTKAGFSSSACLRVELQLLGTAPFRLRSVRPMALPISSAWPSVGMEVSVSFPDHGDDFTGRVTKLEARTFTVHFACDGSDADVKPGQHRYKLLKKPISKPTKTKAKAAAKKRAAPQAAAAAAPKKSRVGTKAAASVTPAKPAKAAAVNAVRTTAATQTAAASAAADDGKSDYELLREEKIKANEAMLRQLGLIGAGLVTHSLQQAVRPKPRMPRPRAPKKAPGDLRRSSRDRSAAPGTYTDLVSLDVDEGPRRKSSFQPVSAAAIDAAEQTAGASAGETFTKVMSPSMVEYSYKFGIGAAGAAVLPVYGSSPGGSRKMIVWMVADTASFGEAAVGSEGLQWPCVYHDHSKNFDGGWQGFAKAHELRTGDVCVFERQPDLFQPARDGGGFTNADLSSGWVRLHCTLHRA